MDERQTKRMTEQESPICCTSTPVYETQYEEMHDISPIVVVAEALAAVKEVAPLEISPLADEIDVDKLQQLFVERKLGETKALTFTVDDWKVTLRDDGLIRVCDPNLPAPSAPVFAKHVRE